MNKEKMWILLGLAFISAGSWFMAFDIGLPLWITGSGIIIITILPGEKSIDE